MEHLRRCRPGSRSRRRRAPGLRASIGRDPAILVGRAGPSGARLADLIAATDLDQADGAPDAHGPSSAPVCWTRTARRAVPSRSRDLRARDAGQRALRPCIRLDPGLDAAEQESGDSAFLSVARRRLLDLPHREDGPYPIKVHSLEAGDRHPLGVGAGSLALLPPIPTGRSSDRRCERRYPGRKVSQLSRRYPVGLVEQTRKNGYSFNPGMMLPDHGRSGWRSAGDDAARSCALDRRHRGTPRRESPADLKKLLAREVSWIIARFAADKTVIDRLSTGSRSSRSDNTRIILPRV